MRLAPGLVVLAVLLALLGCGGGNYPDHPTAAGPLGQGSNGVWLFRPAGKPKNVVIFFHGQGGREEATPVNHRPWIDHLVANGSVVVYPRYEIDYERNPLTHAVAGVSEAVKRFDADGLPVLAIGYSRGGGLVVEYAAVAATNGVPVPDGIMSVFPAGQGDEGKLVDLTSLDRSTRLHIMIGDRDVIVGSAGARVLLRRLQAGGFPAANIQLHFVDSHGSFVANHFAPLQTSASARAAFWRPADRLLANLG
jgi:predicted alpha/beta-hydrolase family hydrolase